jgi:hypothetical protein
MFGSFPSLGIVSNFSSDSKSHENTVQMTKDDQFNYYSDREVSLFPHNLLSIGEKKKRLALTDIRPSETKKFCKGNDDPSLLMKKSFSLRPLIEAKLYLRNLEKSESCNTLEVMELKNSINSILRSIKGPEEKLSWEEVLRNRINVHQRMIQVLYQQKAELKYLKLQVQTIWRLRFERGVMNLKKLDISHEECYSYYQGRFEVITDPNLFKEIEQMKTFEVAVRVAESEPLKTSIEKLSKSSEFVFPRDSIFVPSQNHLEEARSGMMIELQNARELAKMYLLCVIQLRKKSALSSEQILSLMKYFETAIEPILLMDKIIHLFYISPLNLPDVTGVPWIGDHNALHFEDISSFVDLNHSGIISISQDIYHLVSCYFPHLSHHMQPCLPTHLKPQKNQRSQWKKQFVYLSDMSVGKYWCYHSIVTLSTPQKVYNCAIAEMENLTIHKPN